MATFGPAATGGTKSKSRKRKSSEKCGRSIRSLKDRLSFHGDAALENAVDSVAEAALFLN